MGEEGEGIHLHSRKLLAFSLCISEGDIGIVRSRSFVGHSSPFSTLFIGAKKTHSFLRFIHGTGAQCAHPASAARQSVFGRRVSLHHSHSLLLSPSPLLPQSSEGSLSPRYNATPSNPIHRCFSHPHIALLDCSTTSHWVRPPHCVSKESHICSSFYDETMFLICCLSTQLWQDHFCSTLLITRTMSLIPPSPLSPSFSPSFPSSFSCNEI